MGEVVKLVFGHQSAIAKKSTTGAAVDTSDLPEAEREFAALLLGDTSFLTAHEENIVSVREACRVGDEATDYIFGMANFTVIRSNINLRQAALRKIPLMNLAAELLGFDRSVWSARPHIVGAIILEMGMRLTLIQEACPTVIVPRFKE